MIWRTLAMLLTAITAVGATDDTRGYLSAMSDFLESHTLGDAELERVIAACDKGEIVNPILESAADINPITQVYREALQSWITPGKLDAAVVCEFAKSRLSDEVRQKEEQKRATENTRTFVSIAPSTLVASEYYTCAIQDDHTVACWGQVGSTPLPPQSLGPVKSLAAGLSHACAIRWDDTLSCWGSPSMGKTSPPQGLGPVKAVSAGKDHTCVIRADDTVECWGFGANFEPHRAPRDLGAVSAIASRYDTTCTIRTDRTLVCWTGKDVRYGAPARAVAIASQHSYFIGQDHSLASVGHLDLPPPELGRVKAVASGSYHACTILWDDTLACWGRNHYYSVDDYLGQATPPHDLGKVKAVAVGEWHTCVRKLDDTIKCWGSDEYHQVTLPKRWWMQLPVVSNVFAWLHSKAAP